MGKLTSCNRWARDNPFGMITYKLVWCFVLSGTGAEARPMRQRLSDAARRDSQLYQVAFVDGRIGSINAERTAHHPHRIPVSCIQSSPFLCVCVVQHGWISRIHAVLLLLLLLFGQQFVWDSHKSLLSIYRVVKTNQSSTYKVKRVSSSVVWCCILWPDLKNRCCCCCPAASHFEKVRARKSLIPLSNYEIRRQKLTRSYIELPSSNRIPPLSVSARPCSNV